MGSREIHRRSGGIERTSRQRKDRENQSLFPRFLAPEQRSISPEVSSRTERTSRQRRDRENQSPFPRFLAPESLEDQQSGLSTKKVGSDLSTRMLKFLAPEERPTISHLKKEIERSSEHEHAEGPQRPEMVTGSKILCAHKTDAGTIIQPRTWRKSIAGAREKEKPLYCGPDGLRELYRRFLEKNSLRTDQVSPIGPFNIHFNCHGYTFSRDGKLGCVNPRYIDQILQEMSFSRVWDNRSRNYGNPVDCVRPEDVVVYRNEKGSVTHTAVVARVSQDGIYADSKLGMERAGRHKVEDVLASYGPYLEIYHTDRVGGRFMTPIEGTNITSPHWPIEVPFV